MSFILSVIFASLLTVPGMYLISRTRLATSIFETVSNGFFFGFGLIVLVYLTICRFLPVYAVDTVVIVLSVVALPLLIREIRTQRLPLWLPPGSTVQAVLVGLSMVFMIVLAFGELTRCVDDDIWTHLPVVKRISMGDLPPHAPFCPEVAMRGHVGRDTFVGTVARLLDLKPELAIIFVTLAVCPYYILAFHALAWRLARGRPIPSCFCFVGLSFLISCAVGDVGLRYGVLTYVMNHLVFAYSHAVFVGWLLERVMSSWSLEADFITQIRENKLNLMICMISLASMYFVYMSNFLMFVLFIAVLPVLVLFAYPVQRLRRFKYTLGVIGTVGIGSLLLLVLVSPFFLERVLITLKLVQPAEPTGFLQQAQFAFPKMPLFTLTDPSGNDVPFFSLKSLSAQGLSFYLGLAGLILGFMVRDFRLLATASMGLVTMAWMILVDMGDYRADILRLMLLAHMAFGASAGLVIGEAIERIPAWSRKSNSTDDAPGGLKSPYRAAIILLCSVLCLWMGWGNIVKLTANKGYRVDRSFQRLRAICLKDPEHWLDSMAIKSIDFEVFQILSGYIRSPKATVLLRLNQKPGYSPLFLNAESVTGAGVVGTCQSYSQKVDMGRILMDYDYRASLFWQRPSSELLKQLAPDWIALDPSSISDQVLKSVLSLPGVRFARKFEDNEGNKRILLSYKKERTYAAPATLVRSLTPDQSAIKTSPLGLAVLSANVDSENVSASQNIAMLVTDDTGKVVNVLDYPIVGTEVDGAHHMKIYFSMIQSGRWKVYFMDPATKRLLYETPIEVEVSI